MSHAAEEAAHLNAIRSWWRRNGTWVITLVILALTSSASWQLWHTHVMRVRHQASTRFDHLEQALHAKAWSVAGTDLKVLQTQTPTTLYATMGSVLYGKTLLLQAPNVTPQQRHKALQAFQWASDHGRPALIHGLVTLQRVHAICSDDALSSEAAQLALQQLTTVNNTFPVLANVERAACHAAMHQPKQARNDIKALRTLLLTDPGNAPEGLITTLNLWLLTHHG